MIRKIGILGISMLCFAAIISCEKDFNNVGNGVINNTKFETGEVLIDVEIEQIDISDLNANPLYNSVRADNISIGTLGEYWLGVSKGDNYKTIEASFVSQLSLPANLKIQDVKPATEDGDLDSIFVLDKVVLKLPYTATSIGKESDGKPKFRLDSVLGDPNTATSLKVFKNGTYLNTLDPDNPANSNSFQSNHSYIEDRLLSENAGFTFKPSAIDTMLILTRNISNGNTYQDTVKLANKAPFLTIPLDKTEMESLFWDKFEGGEFSDLESFNAHFRGLIVKAEGSDGAMVPLSLLGVNTSASLDFHYTITTFEKEAGQAVLALKDTLPRTYSFPLSGIRNSMYKMTAPTVAAPANNFTIQGTAGTMAKVTILDNTKLQELRDNDWLVNDATLSFYVNQTINTDNNTIPQKLFLYQNKDNGSGGVSPTHISDAYTEAASFGGSLESSDTTPEKYSFRITDYLSNLLTQSEEATIDPLILKVYNTTDTPTNSASVSSYNWNPRGVTLQNGDEAANGTRRAVLKISYSKEK
ncbi:DUF4270 domain-containing protein [Tenacibaculum haliotis]|uniref:DUF4270 domain-containing protein n=1 Tax=Tenacibaculum haliotis TaxID=1888914 RepID=UPI0021AF5678|nr:DUF4270 domain-containing protein [Tenacibaculum haliotis]MCT4697677.1 DUF4270 domain-containing protein [Tenacibaculum haliotis]